MKKLILTILASSFILSCSTNSSNDNSNNPASTGLLVKTITSTNPSGSGTQTFNYNGNKLINSISSDGSYSTWTYNGEYIIAANSVNSSEGSGYIDTFNYSTNLLTSSTHNSNTSNSSDTYNSTYTYNSDGSITEIRTSTYTNTTGNTSSSTNKYIRFYSQGNCVKEDNYSILNGVTTLTGSTTYSYDTNNPPFKNITGFYALLNPQGTRTNNVINSIGKYASGAISYTIQTNYQYNSQNYPITANQTITLYTIDLQTGTSTPGTPTIYSLVYSYY